MVIARRSTCCLTSLIRPNAFCFQPHGFFSRLPGFLLHSFCFFVFFVPLAFRVVCRSALKVVSSRLSDVARDQCCATLCHADQLCITRIGSFQVASSTCLFEKALCCLISFHFAASTQGIIKGPMCCKIHITNIFQHFP